MLKKVSFVCNQCGRTFNREEDCERHEKECTPVYLLFVRLFININGKVNTPNRCYTEANVNVTSSSYTNKQLNNSQFSKTIYAEEDNSQVEIAYEVSNVVPIETDVKEELAAMKSKLINSIISEITIVKTLVESSEISDRLDEAIEKSIRMFEGQRSK